MPACVLTAGTFNCAVFGGSGFGGSGVSVGGFVAGTVIFSLPGSSAFFGGSGFLLPPPPPPPPGPGELSQITSSGTPSGGALAGAGGGARRRWGHPRDHENDEQHRTDVPDEGSGHATAQTTLFALARLDLTNQEVRVGAKARLRNFGHVGGKWD